MSKKEFVSLGKIAGELLKSIEAKYSLNEKKGNVQSTDISVTDFTSFYNALGGFDKKGFYFLFSRPAIGKTEFSLEIALNQAINKKNNVYFFSLEDCSQRIAIKIIRKITGIADKKILNKDLTESEIKSIASCVNTLRDLPVFICDYSDLRTYDIESMLKNENTGNALVIIDYMQLVNFERKHCVSDIKDTFNILKEFADKNNMIILGCSQIHRQPESLHPDDDEKRYGPLPKVRNAAILRDADNILILRRRLYYEDEFGSEIPNEPDMQEAEIVVEKSKYGNPCSCKFMFDTNTYRFI